MSFSSVLHCNLWFSGVKNSSYLVNYTHVMHVEFIALETLAYDIKREC